MSDADIKSPAKCFVCSTFGPVEVACTADGDRPVCRDGYNCASRANRNRYLTEMRAWSRRHQFHVLPPEVSP